MESPYRTVASKQVYAGTVFKVREDQVELPDGKRSPFAVIEMNTGAGVVAVNDAGEIHLIREYKYAVGKPSLELPSGATEPGESPIETARRELREEAGLLASEWIDLGYVDPFTTQLAGPIYLFLARGLTETARELDEGEVIEVVRMKFAEALDKVIRGEITHAGSCVAILKASSLGLAV